MAMGSIEDKKQGHLWIPNIDPIPTKCAKSILHIVQPLAPHANFVNLWIIKVLGKSQIFQRNSSNKSPKSPSDVDIFHMYSSIQVLSRFQCRTCIGRQLQPDQPKAVPTRPAQWAGHFVQQPLGTPPSALWIIALL